MADFSEYNGTHYELENDILKLQGNAEKMLQSFMDCKSDIALINQKKEFYYFLKNKCLSLGIAIDENVTAELEEEMTKICSNVNEKNNLNLNITKDNYEELIKQALNYNENPKLQNMILDSLLNVEIKGDRNTYGIALGILDSLREMDYTNFYFEVTNLIQVLFEEKNDEIDAIFGGSTLNKEYCTSVMHKLFYYMSLSDLLMSRNKFKDIYHEIRNKNVVDIYKIEHPEFYEDLCKLNELEEEFDLFYHGTDSNYISEKICNEGLYMQYGEIDRTAVKGLSPEQIISYSYGHESVGRHSIVIIAVPKGDYPVIPNNDESITIQGTGQGLEASNSFNPKYVIPQNYIYGIIDKDNYQLIDNPSFDKKSEFRR